MGDQLTMPLTGEDRKRAALERMEDNELRAYLLERARKYARGLWKRRARRHGPDNATVSADDVRPFVDKVLEAPDWLNMNWMGQVFRTGNWEKVGWTESKRDNANANPLRLWKYVGDE